VNALDFVAFSSNPSFIEMMMLIHSVLNARSTNAALSQNTTAERAGAVHEMQSLKSVCL